MKDYFVHPSTVVEEGVQIGRGTRVWLFCHIMQGACIGEDCNLGQNVFIDPGVTIGNRVKIQNNVSVYRGVELEDDVFIGPSVVFTNVINPRSFINRQQEIKPTLVRRGATIGANASIVCGVEIGRYAMIGAGAVVTKPVKDYALVAGNPARHKGWVSEKGHALVFKEGLAFCSEEQQSYLLHNYQVQKK